jgi:hypothetical protein
MGDCTNFLAVSMHEMSISSLVLMFCAMFDVLLGDNRREGGLIVVVVALECSAQVQGEDDQLFAWGREA